MGYLELGSFSSSKLTRVGEWKAFKKKRGKFLGEALLLMEPLTAGSVS